MLEAKGAHLPQRVLIVGTGLLGTSIALGLRRKGVSVYLRDNSPVAAELARDLGAGELATEHVLSDERAPELVVVAVPPDVTGRVVCAALDEFPQAIVTDVASVKAVVEAQVLAHTSADRWVGSHPMAGKERSGAIAADADLFAGRPWVLVPSPVVREDAVAFVREVALALGASLHTFAASEHDHSVAVVSHLPQIVSSLLAGVLTEESANTLALSGQGLRDVTRIANSDALLWTSIISSNRTEISQALDKLAVGLNQIRSAVGNAGALDVIAQTIALGNAGVSRIPGKHGGAPARYAEVTVLVPDEPGELGRLFTDVGHIGVNIEDFQMEHSPNQPVGRVALSIVPAHLRELERELSLRGWQVVAESGKSLNPMVVAMDGPSGSGKSTIARKIAQRFALGYLDTGAMYRAAAWWAQHTGVSLDDEAAVLACTRDMPLDMSLDPTNQYVRCAGIDITDAIRAPELSRVVSKVAVNLGVRAELVRRQKAIIDAETLDSGYAQGRGIVAEGRDITTVVAPNAKVRVLLTASEEARLRRRALEVRGSADEATIAATRDEVVRRDRDDSTVSEFMTAQDGVTTIDSSDLTIDEVVHAVAKLIESAS